MADSKELEAKLAEAERKLEAIIKREADWEAREKERAFAMAREAIANGLKLMEERIAADTDPRWLKFLETSQAAQGAGWFAAYTEKQGAKCKRSPAAWLAAIETAMKCRAEIASEPGSNFQALYTAIGEWLEKSATPGFKAACGTGEF